jgi:hypothetical protein
LKTLRAHTDERVRTELRGLFPGWDFEDDPMGYGLVDKAKAVLMQ